jgi:hypothetical protein
MGKLKLISKKKRIQEWLLDPGKGAGNRQIEEGKDVPRGI